MRVTRGERGEWKKGTWRRRERRKDGGCKRKRGRVESKGGSRTSTIATVSRLVLPGFTFGDLDPSPSPLTRSRARPFIIPLRPLIFLFFNCLRPHRALCHPPFATGHYSLFSHPVRLCSFATSSAPHRFATSEHSSSGKPPAVAPYPIRASCFTSDAARHKALVLVPS